METSGPGILFTIAAFIGGFSILVFIHEWGHYAMARLFKVRIETFSIGMGKELWGRTDKHGTRWRFSAIPIGGYVKFFGDASIASNPGDLPEGYNQSDRDACLHFKPLWQRALVSFAGPAVNLIAAVLVLAWLAFTFGVDLTEPKISYVEPETAASDAGLQPGDIIVNVNGRDVERFSEVRDIVRMYPDKIITLEIERDGALVQMQPHLGTRELTDRFGNQYFLGVLGVRPTDPVHQDISLLGALPEGFNRGVYITKTMFTTLGEIIVGLRSVKELGGPVRIAKTFGEAASIGFEQFVWILGLLSLNLGIINLLPIPVLDGGHLMFYGIEAIKGSPLSKKAQEAGFVAGAALMLIFMVFVTLNDLQSLAS